MCVSNLLIAYISAMEYYYIYDIVEWDSKSRDDDCKKTFFFNLILGSGCLMAEREEWGESPVKWLSIQLSSSLFFLLEFFEFYRHDFLSNAIQFFFSSSLAHKTVRVLGIAKWIGNRIDHYSKTECLSVWQSDTTTSAASVFQWAQMLMMIFLPWANTRCVGVWVGGWIWLHVHRTSVHLVEWQLQRLSEKLDIHTRVLRNLYARLCRW